MMTDIRERFLERLTREIFLKKGEGFVLKGGGAMRVLFKEQRLTKDLDLDFTNPKRSADSLHNTLRRAIDTAARGLSLRDLQISEPGKAEASPRWKLNFTDQRGTPCHVEIEVSRDPERAAPGAVVQRPYQPHASTGIGRFWVDIYDEPVLIATKLAALLGREVPRDVYDLDLLSGTGRSPDAALVRWAIERAGLTGEDPIATLWAHLDALTWARFQAELAPALPAEISERVDELEWTAMKLRVGEYVEELLRGVAGDNP